MKNQRNEYKQHEAKVSQRHRERERENGTGKKLNLMSAMYAPKIEIFEHETRLQLKRHPIHWTHQGKMFMKLR